MSPDALEPLAPADAQRLTEFARACKAAARAVTLYPATHPTIVATLGRIAQLTSAQNLASPLKITVLTSELRVDGRAPSRPDAAIGELASLLHDHLIGELTINPGGDVDGWRNFLLLLGRSTDEVRAQGGIARLWSTTAGTHIELKEIDYADVLRERGGVPAQWDGILAGFLQGDGGDQEFDEEATKMLLEIAKDEQQLGELFVALESRGAEDQSSQAKATAVVRMLRSIVNTVKKARPEEMDGVLQNLSGAVGRLSPELMVSMLAQAETATTDTASVIGAVVSRMTEQTIAGFIARNAEAADSSINRVAQAFHTLVQGDDQRQRLIALAHDQAATSPFGSTEGFEDVWNRVAERLLTSYSDKAYVSNTYARELSTTRTQAVTIDQVSDDPPERVSAWLATVATSELRKLDLSLLLDLLVIEEEDGRWGTLMRPVVALLEDLMLVGDFDAAASLLGLIIEASKPGHSKERRQHALIAIDMLVSGSMMRHIVAHVATMDDAQCDRLKAMCLSLGEELVRPLAETISTDVSDRVRDRLSQILVAFGPAGRRQVERLKNSENPAVRRTAIMLLREFGGEEALPELTEMLRDRSPQIQREAVRAILNIGSRRAYEVLQNAITHGSTESRETIMKSLASVRDDRAAPMFGFIISHVDHKGEFLPLYLGAIEALGALKSRDGVESLREALYRGEWWAPRRTASLRSAAAASLARMATPEALEVLEQALSAGPRGVRSAVRPHMSTARSRQKAR
jgi:HEAT repeat protein/PBS lyase HEAT-like repeat-containing protein